MIKRRIGNDIRIEWGLVLKSGRKVDFTHVTGMSVELRHAQTEISYPQAFVKVDNIISVDFIASEQMRPGVYDICLTYQRADSGIENGTGTTTVDKCRVFNLVDRSCDIDDDDATIDIVSVIEKGDPGDPFTYDMFTPEQIEGLQRPAVEAANRADVATGNAEQATTQANAAADNANAKATLASNAAASANTHAISASIAASNATEAADIATLSAQEAEAKAAEAEVAASIAREQASEASASAIFANEQGEFAKEQAEIAGNKADEVDEKVAGYDAKMLEVTSLISAVESAESERDIEESRRNTAEQTREAQEQKRETDTGDAIADVQNWLEGAQEELAGKQGLDEEQTTAHAIAVLTERLKSIESVISSGLMNRLQVEQADIIRLKITGSDFILMGAQAPGIIPDFIGQMYIHVGTAVYVAVNATSVANWKLL